MESIREKVSKNELERRWKAVRGAIESEGIDCLVMQNTNQWLGGYVRYFTDIPAGTYGLSVIFLLDDEMIVIAHGGNTWPLRSSALPTGVKERIFRPYIPTLNFTNLMDAEIVVKTLKEEKVQSLGFVGRALMSAVFYEHISKNVPAMKVCDATDLVDEIKAVKSEEEIRLIRQAIKLQDTVWEDTLTLIRPGVKEYEITSEIRRQASNMGSEAGLIMVGSAPAGSPASQKPIHLQNRTLKDGDQICIMIEVNGPGGFYGEIGRTACINDAPKALREVWRDAAEAQDRTAERMKPGANPKELIDSHNKLLTKMGYPKETRLYAHGQGYDLVERPGGRPEETMTIKASMNMVIHPVTVTKEAYAFCCDNYLITNSGAVRIHETPREVFIV